VWHVGVHPTREVFYAPSQQCAPQQQGAFAEYTIGHVKNYLFEIGGAEARALCTLAHVKDYRFESGGAEARVLRHLAIPKDMPGALTSDVVVTEREVLYNCCASSVVAVVDLADFRTLRHV